MERSGEEWSRVESGREWSRGVVEGGGERVSGGKEGRTRTRTGMMRMGTGTAALRTLPHPDSCWSWSSSGPMECELLQNPVDVPQTDSWRPTRLSSLASLTRPLAHSPSPTRPPSLAPSLTLTRALAPSLAHSHIVAHTVDKLTVTGRGFGRCALLLGCDRDASRIQVLAAPVHGTVPIGPRDIFPSSDYCSSSWGSSSSSSPSFVVLWRFPLLLFLFSCSCCCSCSRSCSRSRSRSCSSSSSSSSPSSPSPSHSPSLPPSWSPSF